MSSQLLFHPGASVSPTGAMDFTSIWQTDNVGTSNNDQITIPTDAAGTYNNVTVDWGDGVVETGFNTFNDARWTHTYPSAGTFTVKISGQFEGILFNDGGDKLKILEITQWGQDFRLGNTAGQFHSCENLILTNVSDVLNLTGSTTLNNTFVGCDSLTSINNIELWDVSGITSFARTFAQISSFTGGDLSGWDVSSGLTFEAMFRDGDVFVGDLSAWDVSAGNATRTFSAMFRGQNLFQSDLSAWNISAASADALSEMFRNCTLFDSDLSSWDVSGKTGFNLFLANTSFSDENYDLLLIGWNAQTLQPNLTFNAGSAQYCDGAAARQNMIDSDGWTFIDGGSACFGSSWQTDNAGTSNNDQITIPTTSAGTYNATVDWGDGIVETGFTTFNDARWTHTFAGGAGTYNVTITGQFEGFQFADGGDKLKILEVIVWGPDFRLGDGGSAFSGCANLTLSNVSDVLDVSAVINFASTFRNCTSLTNIQNINSWDVSSGTQFQSFFFGCSLFSADLSLWDVSSMSNPKFMFEGCSVFVSDLSLWNVSANLTFRQMFNGCSLFVSDLSSWNVAASTDFSFMFQGCVLFVSDLSSWNVASGINFSGMFGACALFVSDLSSWNVASGTLFISMFSGCALFVSDLSSWNVALGTSFFAMFSGCALFVSDLSSWNVGSATNISFMLRNCPLFNSDLSSWQVQNVTGASNFLENTSFSDANYDLLLIAWNALTLQPNVLFGVGTAKYCDGAAARQNMIDSDGWTITDGGSACFESTWTTDNTGTSNDDQITIPTDAAGTYNATVDWGDGNVETGFTTFNDVRWTHTYTSIGTFTVKITGQFEGFTFADGGDRAKLIDILQWGSDFRLGNATEYFRGCVNMLITATDILNLSGTTDMKGAFRNCNILTSIPSITSWDWSAVVKIESLFRNSNVYNQNLNSIDVSSVTDADSAFRNAPLFDQPFDNWVVTSLTSATTMFLDTTLSTTNYDALLISWEGQAVQSSVPFHGGNSQFSAGAAATARAALIATPNFWTITDGGQV